MNELIGRPLPRGIRRWLAPSFVTLVFCLTLASVLIRPAMPVSDPGIGWHLVTGRLVLETGHPVTTDEFSFTRSNQRFVGGAWLFQAFIAGLEKMGGLPLVTAICAILYGLVPVLVYRRMLAEGVPAPVALASAFLACWVLLGHMLDRPHIVTYLLFAWLLSSLWAWRRGDAGVWAMFIHVPLMVVWCNCHRGFVIGLLLVAVFSAAALVDRLMGRVADLRAFWALSGLFFAMAAASLLNPWGWGLHEATTKYLGMESIRFWHEYRSPDFMNGGSAVAAFELMILLLVFAMALGRAHLDWLELALVVVFLHWALQSLRHMNLFAIVAAPPIARGGWGLCQRIPALAGRLAEISRQQAALIGGWIQIACVAIVFLFLALGSDAFFKKNFDGIWLSRGAAEYIGAHPGDFSRPFNTDDLGGSLIYRFWPRLRVFVDDRNEVYGDRFILDEYFAIRNGRGDWQRVLDRHAVDSAIVDSGAIQDVLLGSSPAWSERYRDSKNVIFVRATNVPRP